MRDKSINKEKKKNSYEKHVNKFLRDIDLSDLSTEQHQKAVHLIAEVSDVFFHNIGNFGDVQNFKIKITPDR